MNKYYLSKERYEELEQELEDLKSEGRKKIALRLKHAKDLGDLSENSEYQEARNEQAFLEQRINRLEQIVRNVEIIKKSKSKNFVSVGSEVKVKKNGETLSYTIVGSSESSPDEGFISNESPIGKSLINKKIGETVAVKTPKGIVEYKILGIF